MSGELSVVPDTGCDLAPSCLNCPLPRCRYDYPAASAKPLTEDQKRMCRALLSGEKADDVAAWYRVSRRTVYRTLERYHAEGHG